MKARLALAMLAVHCALTPGAAPHGEPPAATKLPRTDLLGDPLHEPIVARLGTERLCLANARFFAFSPDGKLRAVEALELNGGPEARAVLERLAKGQAGDGLVAEAKAALARLARRAAKD